jgi:hypothetical protein
VGSERPFTILPSALNQSFTNGSNADGLDGSCTLRR